MRFALAALFASLFICSDALAQSLPAGGEAAASFDTGFPKTRVQLGYGNLITNDLLGNGRDRWRTGSITGSHVWGYDWSGQAPQGFGELLELRMQGQVIAPADPQNVNPVDRPYAGLVSLGLHSHNTFRGLELSLGADIVVIGPQTHMDSLQASLHDIFGGPKPSSRVLAQQIENTIRPTAVAEVGRTFSFGETIELRPFAEARAGDETLVRIGADVTFGRIGQGELLVRESVTGQRYRTIYRAMPGFSFVAGGDMAYVADSIYLPENRGYQLERRRDRVRAGLHWQGQKTSAFYGLTYLGPEFAAQDEGQVVGSIRIKLRF